MRSDFEIILIEDDEVIRSGLCEFLESEGYRVTTAANGKQGFEIVSKFRGQGLVLLDLQMPVMTGEQFLIALEKEKVASLSELPIVVLTARGEGFQHSRIAGMIRKPIDLDDLLEKIHSLSK